MAKLSEDIIKNLNDLILHLSKTEEGSEAHSQLKKHYTSVIKKSNHMYFSSNKEIDIHIQDMANKFIMHGFTYQASELETHYKKYMPDRLPESENRNRLNILKFLLEMSVSPTKYFFDHPDEFIPKVEESEDINWANHLLEGIERWEPNFDELSPEDSEESDHSEDETLATDITTIKMPTISEDKHDTVFVDFDVSRQTLLTSVQHSWFRSKTVRHMPESQLEAANFGILWEEHLQEQTGYLIQMPKSNVISEYKVIREVIFQLYNPHNSVVYKLEGDHVKLRGGVTVSSVRWFIFENFMLHTLRYIELMEEFRGIIRYNDVNANCPITYKCYGGFVRTFVDLVHLQIVDLEEHIRKQEVTYTLMKLDNDLRRIFEPLIRLKHVHDRNFVDFAQGDFLGCTVLFLTNLRRSLEMSRDKLEQDMKLALFVECLYHYLNVIQQWLGNNLYTKTTDVTGEFVIEHKPCPEIDWTMSYYVRQGIPADRRDDSMIALLTDYVLKTGRNVQLLRYLKKHDILIAKPNTVYDEFVRRTLQKLCDYYGVDPQTVLPEETPPEESLEVVKYKSPAIYTEGPASAMNKMERLVDVSDGLLMAAFEDYLIEKPKKVKEKEPTLYEKISRITSDRLFPMDDFFETILHDILRERFTVSGLTVKSLLVEEHSLYKEFCFLSHLFLFHEDFMSGFYRDLFGRLAKAFAKGGDKDLGTERRLWPMFQEVVAKVYPGFYQKCQIVVGRSWNDCMEQLEACRTVSIEYHGDWPNTIVITRDHVKKYQESFQFLLLVKWGLHSLNLLDLKDLIRRRKTAKTKTYQSIIRKLQNLRFCLLDLTNSLQHFIFGNFFRKCRSTFELDFEKSKDLDALRKAHHNYVTDFHNFLTHIANVKKEESQTTVIFKLLDVIRRLQNMWNSFKYATHDELERCHKEYKTCYELLFPILNPAQIIN